MTEIQPFTFPATGQPVRPRLPAYGQEAHTYLVEFSNGTIKAGYTANPTGRMSHHRRNAACFDITITREWISEPHLEARNNELELLAWGRRHAERIVLREYFVGVDYSAFEIFAKSLPMRRYADGEFQAYLKGQKKRTEMLASVVLPALPVAFSELTGELSAHRPEDVSAVAQLAEITTSGAIWTLSHKAPQEILKRWLQEVSDAYAAKDRPKSDPAVMSAWEWITSPDTDARYCNLIDPLHRAAEAAGFELEEKPPWVATGETR